MTEAASPLDESALSKTQRKAASHALQKLGEALVALRTDQLAAVELPEVLRDAVIECKRLSKHEAIRRQLQYIGRLMRDIDPAPIQSYLDALQGVSTQHSAWLHQLERWRERLLSDPQALTEFIALYPQSDAHHLRQLLRQAVVERNLNKSPRAYREIFQLLKSVLPEPLTGTEGS